MKTTGIKLAPIAWLIPGSDTANEKGYLDAMAWQDGEFTLPVYALDPAFIERIGALEAENARLKADREVDVQFVAKYQDALRKLHQHTLDRGQIGIPNGDGTYTEVNDGAEYSDSDLYDLVQSTLDWQPGKHRWHTRLNLICCRDCGFVMNMDRPNKPCKGPVKVGLREMLDNVVAARTALTQGGHDV